MKRTNCPVVLAVLVIVLVLQVVPAQAWSKYYEGIEYSVGGGGGGQTAYCARIHVKNPDVWTRATSGSGPYEFTRQTTSSFRSTYGLKVALNANFFNIASPTYDTYTYADGLVVALGVLASAASGRGCVSVQTDKTLYCGWDNGVPANRWNAVSGAPSILLHNGGNNGDPNSPVTPMSVIGVSQDGKYLYLIAINGCNSYQAASWAAYFGCYSAIQLDGGGSTSMSWENLGTLIGCVRKVAVSFGAGSTDINTQGPSAVAMNPDRMDIVRRGPFNNVILMTWTSYGGWEAPVDLGGVTYDAPAITSRGDGLLSVFIRGTDNHLYNRYYSNGVWSANWQYRGGNILSGPSACCRDYDHVDIVARGTDNTIQYLKFENGAWAPWTSLGGVTYDKPAIVSRDPGRLSVFYRGTNNQVYRNYWYSGVWSAWTSMGGTCTSGLSAVSRDPSRISVYFRGSGGDLQQFYSIDSTWYGPSTLVGSISGAPGACTRDADHIDIFLRSPEDILTTKTWVSPNNWSEFSSICQYY